jgi:hypothetical protein
MLEAWRDPLPFRLSDTPFVDALWRHLLTSEPKTTLAVAQTFCRWVHVHLWSAWCRCQHACPYTFQWPSTHGGHAKWSSWQPDSPPTHCPIFIYLKEALPVWSILSLTSSKTCRQFLFRWSIALRVANVVAIRPNVVPNRRWRNNAAALRSSNSLNRVLDATTKLNGAYPHFTAMTGSSAPPSFLIDI